MVALFFDCELGTVDVCPAVGGEGNFQIMIDGKFQGYMSRSDARWVSWLERRSKLTQADIDSLGTMLDEPEGYVVKFRVLGERGGIGCK